MLNVMESGIVKNDEENYMWKNLFGNYDKDYDKNYDKYNLCLIKILLDYLTKIMPVTCPKLYMTQTGYNKNKHYKTNKYL